MATGTAAQRAEAPRPSDKARRLGNRLLVAVREDVAAHQRILAQLAEQEAHVVRPAEKAFAEATEALEFELERQPFRAMQRNKLFQELSVEFGVEPTAMTLTSVAERLGTSGQPLLVERNRLRELAHRVQRQNRRLAALIRTHRDVTREILSAVLGDDAGGDLLGGGTLIDAEV